MSKQETVQHPQQSQQLPQPQQAQQLPQQQSQHQVQEYQEFESFLGLSAQEVAEAHSKGDVNVNTDVKTKSVLSIVREHTLTLFNAINLFLAVLVVSTGAYKNIAFMAIVLANMVIGITQEIKAKRLVDKLQVITAKKVLAKRDAKVVELLVEDIVLGDVLILRRGDQIPADAQVLAGSALVCESMLTGESNDIEKKTGSEVFSGSYVTSGVMCVRVLRVGQDGYAARINAEAKAAKKVESQILGTLKMIVKWGTYVLIPLGILLFMRLIFMQNVGYNQAILQTVAAVIGMIPQGLVLLTSSVFALATIRLARHEVLVQQAYCVEALARVDVLCLDKTGTLTTGDMSVVQTIGQDVLRIAATIVDANRTDMNETARAIWSYAQENREAPQACVRAIPFSSKTKYSGCVTVDGKAYVMGAAQFVLQNEYHLYKDKLDSFDPACRLLVVAQVDGFTEAGKLIGKPHFCGILALVDVLRSSCKETLSYFYDQGVDVRIISGDDPRTVGKLAHLAGVLHADCVCDTTNLKSDNDVRNAVRNYTIFGRVTPHMKKRLVSALKQEGHTVAMTGDGVNDILALKEADCSIAMAAGCAAARNISELVLVDNDFSHLPNVVAEGRRSINNLERSASLFLMKTAYSALLAAICVLLPPYPFIPVQMSLVNASVIGVPSFLLALEPNRERVCGNFLQKVLRQSIPGSLAVVISLTATLVVARIFGFRVEELSFIGMMQLFCVGYALIFSISYPFNVTRGFIFAISLGIGIIGGTVFGNFFAVMRPRLELAITALVLCAVSLALFVFLKRMLAKGNYLKAIMKT